jgi:hypothetical protein
MAQALLVSVDIPTGAAVVRAMEAAGIRVKAALWAYLEDYYGDWRMIVASPDLDGDDGYKRIQKAIAAAGLPLHKIDLPMIMPMKSQFIRDFRRSYAKMKDVEGLRPRGHVFADHFVSDGYIYRAA